MSNHNLDYESCGCGYLVNLPDRSMALPYHARHLRNGMALTAVPVSRSSLEGGQPGRRTAMGLLRTAVGKFINSTAIARLRRNVDSARWLAVLTR